jgi:hypothetical protein
MTRSSSRWKWDVRYNELTEGRLRAALPPVVSSVSCVGPGLHKTLKLRWHVSTGGSEESNSTCQSRVDEVMVLVLVPQGAYLDVDELRRRHDFRAYQGGGEAAPPVAQRRLTRPAVHAGTSAIDIEQPASASRQHYVALVLGLEGLAAGPAGYSFGFDLALHVRYPPLSPGVEGNIGGLGGQPARPDGQSDGQPDGQPAATALHPPLVFARREGSFSDDGSRAWALVGREVGQAPTTPLPFPRAHPGHAAAALAMTALAQLFAIAVLTWAVLY